MVVSMVGDLVECTVTCNEPENADCHLGCDKGCEEWDWDHESDFPGHHLVPMRDQDGALLCYVKDSIEKDDGLSQHAGEEVLWEGPIWHEYDEDFGVRWWIVPVLSAGREAAT